MRPQKKLFVAIFGLVALIGAACAMLGLVGNSPYFSNGVAVVPSARADDANGGGGNTPQDTMSVNAGATGATYYVDSAAGVDSNSGTSASTPFRTLARVNTIVLQPGDAILLRAGAVWRSESLNLRGSGAPGRPIVIDRYGTGAKPQIDFADFAIDGEGFGIRIINGSHWEIRNLDITSGQQSTARRRNGILIVGTGTGAGAFRHIHVVGNTIHDIFGVDRRSGGINFHARRAAASDPEPSWDDVLIENNVVDNVADTGIQTMTDALLSQTGWTRLKTTYYRVLIRRNIVTRIHRDGILVRAAQDPLVEYNKTDMVGRYTTASGTTASYLPDVQVVAAQWMYYVDRGIFQYNEASRTRKIAADGQPWDFDVGVNDSIYQYNYSHDNEGGALLVMNDTSRNIFRYNISQNDLDLDRGAIAINTGFTGTIDIYNNVFFRNKGQTAVLAATASNGGVAAYKNNVFYGNGSFQTGNGIRYEANTFFGSRSGMAPDPRKITSDPLFAVPGGATSIADAAVSYTLAAGSASRNSGIALSGNGGIDLAGRILPASEIDRGAVEGDAAIIEPGSNLFEAATLGQWSVVSGDWSVGGTPGALRSNGVAGEGLVTTGDGGWASYSVSAPVAVDTAYGNAGLMVRYGGPQSFLMARINDTNDTVELLLRSSAGFSVLGSSPYAVEVGAFAPLRIDVAGQSVSVWLSGRKVIETSIPGSMLQEGKVGVRTAQSTGRFDEVVIRR